MRDEKLRVTSPTFNIVQIYETSIGDIWHVDLYRLNNINEIEEIGILEAMQESICLIEWPELLDDLIQSREYIKICL
jgi:tRNA threonylcarbamoyladenosine biosynthesis protein TsaE